VGNVRGFSIEETFSPGGSNIFAPHTSSQQLAAISGAGTGSILPPRAHHQRVIHDTRCLGKVLRAAHGIIRGARLVGPRTVQVGDVATDRIALGGINEGFTGSYGILLKREINKKKKKRYNIAINTD
jgi:hypothetical protein